MPKAPPNGKRRREDASEDRPGPSTKRLKTDITSWTTPRYPWLASIQSASEVGIEHVLALCGLGLLAKTPLCLNKFQRRADSEGSVVEVSDGEDETAHSCSKVKCKNNPYCLNYLGQERWENEDAAKKAYLKRRRVSKDPKTRMRNNGVPCGLKNLGATCYVNAAVQVWMHDLAFRRAVLSCRPTVSESLPLELSPLFQLQATFASLERGKLAVFDPVKLIESLQLRASEQQDAQEFSKLFMSLLSREFQRQEVPGLKTFLTSQFQGDQVYGTQCHGCQYRSERQTNFLELEISLTANCTLRERLKAALESEVLSGNNQYRCPNCNRLQDATRYTELRQLPPVLNFSIQRFVFDFETLDRKKSKQVISFPPVIDMNEYIGDRTQSGHVDELLSRYELRGVLLHKGASAHHGHYEAQVYNSSDATWYQFNDEAVTKMESLHLRPRNSHEDDTGKAPKRRGKKRAVEEESPARDATNHSTGYGADISSRDCYMLVYARVTPGTHIPHSPSDTELSPEVQEHLANAEANINNEILAYSERLQVVEEEFKALKKRKQEVYHSWGLGSRSDPGKVILKDALSEWLLRELDHPSTTAVNASEDSCGQEKDIPSDGGDRNGETGTGSDITVVENTPKSTPVEASKPVETTPNDQESKPPSGSTSNLRLRCTHGQLDPSRFVDIKVVTLDAFDSISNEIGIEPWFQFDDMCLECGRAIIKEYLWVLHHPDQVAQLEKQLEVEDEEMPSFWISKPWLKDWRSRKPKMHQPGVLDPAPDSGSFKSDVLCDHGGLVHAAQGRVKVNSAACSYLVDLFPTWNPVPVTQELCELCEAAFESSKPNRSAAKLQISLEKTKLKDLPVKNPLTDHFKPLPCNEPYAVIPTQWIKDWRMWSTKPQEFSRPSPVDNYAFICDHHKVVFDLNEGDRFMTGVFVVPIDVWNCILELYPGSGPFVAIQRGDDGRITSTDELCFECRLKKRSIFDVAPVSVYILGRDEPLPTPQQHSRIHSSPAGTIPQLVNGSRRSRRIRDGKNSGKLFKLQVSKEMDIKEIKMEIQAVEKIPTICQRLFFKGVELEDNEGTVGQLGILANDLLEVKALDLGGGGSDVEMISASSDGETKEGYKHGKRRVPKKEAEAEGPAFGGTLLSGI